MKNYLLLLLVPLFFFFYGTANSTFYTWEDENGATQITDYPPPKGKTAKDVQVHKYESEDFTSLLKSKEEQESSSNEAKLKSKKKTGVIIYTKDDCKECDKAREFLKSKNISFTEYNMDKDKDSVTQRKEIDEGDDVPFAIINKNHVYGFSESVYNRALKSNSDLK